MKRIIMAMAVCVAACTGARAQTTNMAVNAMQQVDDNRHTQPETRRERLRRNRHEASATNRGHAAEGLRNGPMNTPDYNRPAIAPRTTGSGASPTPTPDNPVR